MSSLEGGLAFGATGQGWGPQGGSCLSSREGAELCVPRGNASGLLRGSDSSPLSSSHCAWGAGLRGSLGISDLGEEEGWGARQWAGPPLHQQEAPIF